MKRYTFDTKKYEFRKYVESIFSQPLESLHQNLGIVNEHTDQDTNFHKIYYEKINTTPFYDAYQELIKNVVAPIFDEEIIYQRIPTFRVHMKGNLAVGAFHRDSEYFHDTSEVNIFLPLTDAYGNNTIWAESKKDLSDYSPMDAKYGEFIVWDGANLMHGNKINDTETSRVSIDFRILPMSKYNRESAKESLTNKTKMTIGHYWSSL